MSSIGPKRLFVLLVLTALLMVISPLTAQEEGSSPSGEPAEELSSGQEVVFSWVNTALEGASVQTYVTYYNLRFARSAWQQQAIDEATFTDYVQTQQQSVTVYTSRLGRLQGLLQEDDPFRSEVASLAQIYSKLDSLQTELLKLPAGNADTEKLDSLQSSLEQDLNEYFGVDPEAGNGSTRLPSPGGENSPDSSPDSGRE